MANKRLNAIITIGGAVTSSLGSALGSVKGKLNDIGGAIRKLEREQRSLGDGIKRAQASQFDPALTGLKNRYAAVTAEVEKLRRAQSRLTSANAGMAAGKARMGSAGLALGVAAAAMAPVGMLMSDSAEHEYQLRLIGNTANMTAAEVKALGVAVLEASKRTGQSTEEIRKAIGFMVAAGMDVKTAQATLDQVGRAATASGAEIEDLAKAAFTLNDSLKVQPGAEMAAALDTLAQAGKDGNVELKDMAKQLPVLGAGFVSLKMQGREAAATMAAGLEIARKGAADADEAANNMKNFIAKIMSPETLKKAKKNFNIDLYKIISDAQKKGANPFEASMEAIIKATKGDQKAIGELFQDMQVQNFLRPMIQQWDEYKKIKERALNAKGVIDQDFKNIADTNKQKMNEMANAADRLGKAFSTVLTPAFGSLLGVVTPALITFTDFVDKHHELVGTVMTVVGTVGASFATWKGLTLVLGAATWAFNALRLAVMTNPIGLVLTGIAVGAVMIYKYWEPITKWLGDRIDWLGDKWKQFKKWIGIGGDTGTGPSAPAPTVSSGMPLPGLPATGRVGSQYTDNSTTTIQVTQLPGQDSKALADEIARKLQTQQRTRSRSVMFDPVTP